MKLPLKFKENDRKLRTALFEELSVEFAQNVRKSRRLSKHLKSPCDSPSRLKILEKGKFWCLLILIRRKRILFNNSTPKKFSNFGGNGKNYHTMSNFCHKYVEPLNFSYSDRHLSQFIFTGRSVNFFFKKIWKSD